MGLLSKVKGLFSKAKEEVQSRVPQSNFTNGLKEAYPIAQPAVNLSKEDAKVNLSKLTQTAQKVILSKGLDKQRARVVLVVDISGSMADIYSRGTVQRACERLLALAMNFDDNGAADVFAFGSHSHEIGEISAENFYQFVQREIISAHPLECSTNYSPAMRQVIKLASSPGDPVYCLFITDGNADDPNSASAIIRQASGTPIYWQFVGIGRASFNVLKSMDTMPGRSLVNTGFFQLNDLDNISDDDLYNRMLNGFPRWLREAKNKGIY